MRRNHTFDTSEELLVQRWGRGVKLTKPEDCKQSSIGELSPPSVRHLFGMPFNVYFLNTQSVIQNMSETAAHLCGFQGKNDAIGRTARAVSKKVSAEFSIRHNEEVISHNSIVIKDEHFLRLDDFEFRDVAIKFPLLNSANKVIGVFGCSIIKDSVAQSLNLLMNTGLLATSGTLETHQHDSLIDFNSGTEHHKLNDLRIRLSEQAKVEISKREVECLFYLMKGKSARETGAVLNLSQRTVEYYLNCLKEKLYCTRKSELIGAVFKLI